MKRTTAGVEMAKLFEIGKTYIHATGKQLTIIGAVQSVAYGLTLIGEDERGVFTPVGSDLDSFANWKKAQASSTQ